MLLLISMLPSVLLKLTVSPNFTVSPAPPWALMLKPLFVNCWSKSAIWPSVAARSAWMLFGSYLVLLKPVISPVLPSIAIVCVLPPTLMMPAPTLVVRLLSALLTFRPLASRVVNVWPDASCKFTLLRSKSSAVAMVKVLPSRLTSMFLPLLNWTVSPAFTALAVSLSLCSFQPWLRLAMSPVFCVTWLLTWVKSWLVLCNCEPFTASLDVLLSAPSATLVIFWLPALMPVLPIETALAVPWLNTNCSEP